MCRRLTGAVFGWGFERIARALALFRADDERFSDEEILTILCAGEAGLKLADVCAAGGILMVTYSVWKAKYKGLTPSEVRDRRQRERRRRRVTMAALAALVVISVGAASMLIGIPNASQSQKASANAPENPLTPRPAAPAATSVPAPNLQSAAAAGPELQSPADRQPSQEADAAQPVDPRGTMSVNAEDIKTSDPDGYLVQVAAVPDLLEARAVLEQLTEAGHSAYLTAKVVDQVELYRVRVGPFKSRPVAEAAARRLEREGHRAPWVTK